MYEDRTQRLGEVKGASLTIVIAGDMCPPDIPPAMSAR